MTADVTSTAAGEIPVLTAILHVYSIDQLLQLQYSPLVSKPATIVDLRELFPAASPHNVSAGPVRAKRYVPPSGRSAGNVNTHPNGTLNQKYVTPSHRNDNKFEATRKIDFNTKSGMNRNSLNHSNNNGYSLEDDEDDDPQWLEPGDTCEMPVATDHSIEEFERWKAEMKARDGLVDSSPVQLQATAIEFSQPPLLESKQGVEVSIFSSFFPVSPENNKVDITHSTKTDNDFFLSLLNKQQESVPQKTLPDSPVSVKDDPIYAGNRRSSDGRTNSNSSTLGNIQEAPPPGLDYTFFPPPPGLTQEEVNSDSNALVNGKNRDGNNRNTIPFRIWDPFYSYGSWPWTPRRAWWPWGAWRP
ncbi:hypothetical protein DV451_003890 [Geotrichum candidum]|uniref:Uncharacterized protein n=1 Tax=Geotrichum candidum TaxID=1173061 RepID=A0A9P5KT51_GEOCN|nr:hypothetical protein DV451_003890 [Geotrichum candidum]KAF5105577.1 hypothetical protein DV453_004683 [Geotrichum candidum]